MKAKPNRAVRPTSMTLLIRRAGVARSQKECNQALANALETIGVRLVEKAYFYTKFAKRRELAVGDIDLALKEIFSKL